MKAMQHTNHPILSVILWFTSFVMYLFSETVIDGIYTWGFRLLSLISLTLIIGVNWKKGIQGIKDMFMKTNKSKKNGKH